MDWKTLINRVGTVAEIAAILELPYSTVHSRVTRNASLPAEWAVIINKKKRIPLNELRPDVWQ